MTRHLRRFEVLIPLQLSDGTELPIDWVKETRRELEYGCGGVTVEAQLVRGFGRESGVSEDQEVRYLVELLDTPEHLAYFYKLRELLKARFSKIEVRIVTYLVGVI